MYRYRISEWSEEGVGSLSRWDRLNDWYGEPSAFVTTGCVIYLVIAALLPGRLFHEPETLFTVVVWPSLISVFGSKIAPPSERLARLQRLLDRPEAVPQFPVRVRYRRGSLVYGRDVGVATLLNGCLSFEGEQSRFSVPQRIDSWCNWTQEGPSTARCRIHVEEDDLSIDCQFVSSLHGDSDGKHWMSKRQRFSPLSADAIQRWDSMPPIPDTQFLLPPVLPSRQELKVLRWQLNTCLLSAFCVLFALLSAVRVGDPYALRTADLAVFLFSTIAVLSGGYWWWRRRALLKMAQARIVKPVQADQDMPASIEETEQHGELNQAG